MSEDDPPLRSVAYEPPGGSSLFDRWEIGAGATLPAPLAVSDARYRSRILELLAPHLHLGPRLLSVGAGNGFMEVELAAAGWDVLATDRAESALRLCHAKGLRTARFELLKDDPIGEFDVIYCDGVMGHLWRPPSRTAAVWEALARLTHQGGYCLASNDLADDDTSEQFAVRSSPEARFYRPPAGWFARDATGSGAWSIESASFYQYARPGTTRRREILVARSLVDKRIEEEDRPKLDGREWPSGDQMR